MGAGGNWNEQLDHLLHREGYILACGPRAAICHLDAGRKDGGTTLNCVVWWFLRQTLVRHRSETPGATVCAHEINFDFGTRDGGSPAAAPQIGPFPSVAQPITTPVSGKQVHRRKRNAAGWFDPTPPAPEHAKT